ncbi:hypothetical protein [Streptomyces sp. URMC 123]|uniref:hypothetical protein n=1 Tax=Streptomyces sp. URMC 123 TaxID=3423403 RepID=UPI003F1A7035
MYISVSPVMDAAEFVELHLGIDRELFRGPLGPERRQERAARLDVAREVIADLAAEGAAGDEIAAWDALYADALMRTVPFLHATRRTEPTVAGRDDTGVEAA